MRKRQSYIPKRDDDFFNFQASLANKVTANTVAWGIPENAFRILAEQRSIYEPLYHKIQDKKTRTSVDVSEHRRVKKEYEKAIRVFVKAYLMFNPNILEKVSMGLADGIEVKFALVAPDAPAPDNPLTCPYAKISTKARFMIEAGITNTGKRFYGFFRWVNFRREEHSGPWTEVQTIVIS